MDSEDKLQNVLNEIKSGDLDFQPRIVNTVLNMNKYDEVTGSLKHEDDPGVAR